MFFLSNCDILIHPIPTSFSLLIFIVFPPENCQSVSHFKSQRVLPYPEREFSWMPIFIALPMMPSANSGMRFASKPLYLLAPISLQTIFAPVDTFWISAAGWASLWIPICRNAVFLLPASISLPKCCKKQMHWPYPKHSFCSVMC